MSTTITTKSTFDNVSINLFSNKCNEQFLSLTAFLKNTVSMLDTKEGKDMLQKNDLTADMFTVPFIMGCFPFITVDGKKKLCKLAKITKTQAENGFSTEDIATICDNGKDYRITLGGKIETAPLEGTCKPLHSTQMAENITITYLKPIEKWSFKSVILTVCKAKNKNISMATIAAAKAERDAKKNIEKANKPAADKLNDKAESEAVATETVEKAPAKQRAKKA